MELDNILNGKPKYEIGIPERPSKNSEKDSFGKIGKGKLDALKDSVKEVEFLIKQREELSEKMSKETEKIKTEIENFLLKNSAVDAEGFKERNGLRQKKIEISELELNEKINCWRDVALLKKELREKQRELSEKEDRINMLDKILE